MEEVSLSEPESHYYADLFQRCDEERTGKITMLKATELYRAADISNEKIQEIMGLAGIPATALHISRAQFYSCLKLIAAHQSSIPLWKQLIAASVTLPLPSFRWTDAFNNPDTKSNLRQMAAAKLVSSHSLPNNESKVTGIGDTQSEETLTIINSDVPSTDSEVEHCESSCGGDREDINGLPTTGNPMLMHHHHRHHHHHHDHGGEHNRGSPEEAWSTNSDSPTPTNSVAERSWFKDPTWLGLLGEEHKQLLGTEEESSDRHSSDDDNDHDLNVLYQITQEQREYYLKQFKQVIQNSPDGLLSGLEAKVFFEKSRIPVEELRHIWELCDVSKDGALSLAEFTAAMHLVVLRRNNIPLPKVLPTCLHPNMLFQGATTALTGGSKSVSNKQGQGQGQGDSADLMLMVVGNLDKTKVKEQTALESGKNGGGGHHHNQQYPSQLPQHSQPSLNSNLMMSLSTLSIASQSGAANSNSNTSNNTQQSSLTSPTITRSPSNSPKLESLATSPPSLTAANLTTGSGTSNASNAREQRPIEWPVAEVQSSQWTKFAESPTSHVNSPGPKPVNFDIQLTTQAVVSDPQILHPVALRVTPVGGSGGATSCLMAKDNRTFSRENSSPTQLNGPAGTSSTKGATNLSIGNGTAASVSSGKPAWESSPTVGNYGSGDLRAIQRPQAKKVIPNKNIGALPPPPQRSVDVPQYQQFYHQQGTSSSLEAEVNSTCSVAGNPKNMQCLKKEGPPPPLPPPRPRRHTRSSSLDLNKYKVTTNGMANGGRKQLNDQTYEESTFFADFTHFSQGDVQDNWNGGGGSISNVTRQQAPYSLPMYSLLAESKASPLLALPTLRSMLQSNQRTSAFEVYRKPNLLQETEPLADTGMSIDPLKRSQTFKLGTENNYPGNTNHYAYGYNMDLLRQLREQNRMLLSVCGDLSDELVMVQARREDIRLRLDTQRSLLSKQGNFPSGSSGEATGRAAPGYSISAPVTANVTGGSASSGIQSNA